MCSPRMSLSCAEIGIYQTVIGKTMPIYPYSTIHNYTSIIQLRGSLGRSR